MQDLTYWKAKHLKLDRHLPVLGPNDSPAPLVVWIHGRATDCVPHQLILEPGIGHGFSFGAGRQPLPGDLRQPLLEFLRRYPGPPPGPTSPAPSSA